MRRTGRVLIYEVAVLARIGGRYDPPWALFAVWRGCSGPYRWPLRAVVAGICCMKWRFCPGMSRIGRYLLCEVAVLARIGGRDDSCWLRAAARAGGSGPYRWPL